MYVYGTVDPHPITPKPRKSEVKGHVIRLDSVHEEAHKSLNRIAINYWQISLELANPVLKGRVLLSEFFTNLNGLGSQAIWISEGQLTLLYTYTNNGTYQSLVQL